MAPALQSPRRTHAGHKSVNSRSIEDLLAEELELDPKDAELRECLSWQCGIADAISAYIDVVPGAFESLLKAHEQIEHAGIAISDVTPDSKPLVERLREASRQVLEVTNAAREPLKTMRGYLKACFDDLNQADCAMLELRRYSQKVEGLTAAQGLERQERRGLVAAALGNLAGKSDHRLGYSARAPSARILRNRQKMQTWADEACLRQARARDLLQACASRQDALIEVVQSIIRSIIKAVGIASGCCPLVEDLAFGPLKRPSEGPLTFKFSVLPGMPFDVKASSKYDATTPPYIPSSLVESSEKELNLMPSAEEIHKVHHADNLDACGDNTVLVAQETSTLMLPSLALAEELEAYGDGAELRARANVMDFSGSAQVLQKAELTEAMPTCSSDASRLASPDVDPPLDTGGVYCMDDDMCESPFQTLEFAPIVRASGDASDAISAAGIRQHVQYQDFDRIRTCPKISPRWS